MTNVKRTGWFVLAALLLPTTASAGDDSLWTVGASVSHFFQGKTPKNPLAVDVTFVPQTRGFIYWLSGGLRAGQASDEWAGSVYFETGMYLFLNLGAGFSLSQGGNMPKGALHLFIGAPWGGNVGDAYVYIEPYYRPNLGVTDGSGFHELGILIKVMNQNIK